MIQFRPAVTSEAKPLIGLYAQSGCGKSYSSLLLAKGFTGNMEQVGMIETESGRGEVFADDPVVGGYRVCSIRDDFSPKAYHAALREAEKAHLRALILDSASHEWEGAGGVLSMAAANQAAGKKGPLVWQQPKIDHQREFLLPLLQTPIALVIVNMRAKFPMVEVNKGGAKEWQRSTELEPKQSEDILFEMMVHGWIDQQHRLHVTKYTKDTFKTIFLDGQPITVETGQRLAAWATGVKAAAPTAPANQPPQATPDALLKAQFKRLMAFAQGDRELAKRILGTVTGEWGAAMQSFNDMTSEEVQRFADTSDDALRDAATRAAERSE